MTIYKINPFKWKKIKGIDKEYIALGTDGYICNCYFKFFTNYTWTSVAFYKKNDFFLEKGSLFYHNNKKNTYKYYKFLIIKSFFQFITLNIINKIKK